MRFSAMNLSVCCAVLYRTRGVKDSTNTYLPTQRDVDSETKGRHTKTHIYLLLPIKHIHATFKCKSTHVGVKSGLQWVYVCLCFATSGIRFGSGTLLSIVAVAAAVLLCFTYFSFSFVLPLTWSPSSLFLKYSKLESPVTSSGHSSSRMYCSLRWFRMPTCCTVPAH